MDTSFQDYLNDSARDSSALVEEYDDESLSILDNDSGLTDDDIFEDHTEQELENAQNEDSQELQTFDDPASCQHAQDTTVHQTPPTSTRNASDRGPLSPFSPLLRPNKTQRSESAISWQSQTTNPDLSLLPCRKVSVVVKVKFPDMDYSKMCLFPLLTGTMYMDGSSPRSATLQAISGMETHDLVAVNPSAFGKYIPAQVTMDTARLVANVVSTVKKNTVFVLTVSLTLIIHIYHYSNFAGQH